MTPMSHQRSNTQDVLCLAQTRQPLMRLIINTRLKAQSGRVCKRRSSNSTKTWTMQHSRPRPSLTTRPLDLRPEQFDSAIAIFERLQTIPHLANQTPRLRLPDDTVQNGEYELEYPLYQFWKLAGGSTPLELKKKITLASG